VSGTSEDTKGAAVIRLTDRQRRIAALISDGFSDKEIAQLEVIDPETVGYHIGQIVKRLNLNRSRNFRVQITRAFVEYEQRLKADNESEAAD
jgi:DNA-binding CsgD family transcriptional regulator